MASLIECKQKEIDELKNNLNTETIGKAIKYYDIVDSTNEIACKLASEGAEEGTVILAGMQKTGKGRLGREWVSLRGGVWFSIILRPNIKPSEAARVTMIGGIGVTRTLEKFGLNANIKWPNDVLIDGKKVCGILTEARTNENKLTYLVLGIGLNADFDLEDLPENIRGNATTLRHEMGNDLQTQELLPCILWEIDKCYELLSSGNLAEIKEAWIKLSATLGKKVKILTSKETVEGIALDVDDSGALIVRTEAGDTQRILTGDCTHISRPG
jgi:BirA family biotin operon repressor/biotin-[acetyl-CoA-carboxylase] ligase